MLLSPPQTAGEGEGRSEIQDSAGETASTLHPAHSSAAEPSLQSFSVAHFAKHSNPLFLWDFGLYEADWVRLCHFTAEQTEAQWVQWTSPKVWGEYMLHLTLGS